MHTLAVAIEDVLAAVLVEEDGAGSAVAEEPTADGSLC
jgi:hypothetical protein